jgi:F420-non-reducing hydrogenase large subunit
MPEMVLQPITRIEGPARVIIQLDGDGEVANARVAISSLRGFEKFVVGRPLEELPRIVTRICGVCPWAHHLASARACDAILGAEIPSAAEKLRELAYMAHLIHSHILHFFVLSGPDLLLDDDTEPSRMNLMGVWQKYPEIIQKALNIRHKAQMISQIVGGRAIHPDVAVPGGWSKPLGSGELAQMKEMGQECLEFAVIAMEFARGIVFPRLLEQEEPEKRIATGFLGTVAGGALSLYDGSLRLMAADGSCQEFPAVDYQQHITETIEPDSYGRLTYAVPPSGSNAYPDIPGNIYRAGALARVNVCDRISTPLAQQELEVFRQVFGRPAQQTALYHWARMIELLFAAERLWELLDDPEIIDPFTRKTVQLRAGRGVGAVEAPRGTLIHDYTADERGLVTAANIIVGTTHNNAAMNLSVGAVARSHIKRGECDAELLRKIEREVRGYDP